MVIFLTVGFLDGLCNRSNHRHVAKHPDPPPPLLLTLRSTHGTTSWQPTWKFHPSLRVTFFMSSHTLLITQATPCLISGSRTHLVLRSAQSNFSYYVLKCFKMNGVNPTPPYKANRYGCSRQKLHLPTAKSVPEFVEPMLCVQTSLAVNFECYVFPNI